MTNLVKHEIQCTLDIQKGGLLPILSYTHLKSIVLCTKLSVMLYIMLLCNYTVYCL